MIDTFTDPYLHEEERPRLGGQNGKILARLQEGAATNVELEKCSGSRRVNSRVADVRRHLQTTERRTITCTPIDVKKGIHSYEICDCA